jgi:hypothetical protein
MAIPLFSIGSNSALIQTLKRGEEKRRGEGKVTFSGISIQTFDDVRFAVYFAVREIRVVFRGIEKSIVRDTQKVLFHSHYPLFLNK